MIAHYQKELITDCSEINKQINTIVDNRIPQNIFCDTGVDTLTKDIQSNLFIKHSPSIVCIVDYSTKKYLYVSENIVNELDISPEELKTVGLGRALLNFEENQRNFFLQTLYPEIFEQYAKYAPSNQAKDLHATYNTLLKTTNGEYKWYFHQLAVLGCDQNGFPRYGLKFLSNISAYKSDDILNFNIYKKDPVKETELIFSRDYYPQEINNSLSEREREIIILIKKGYTTKQIADELFISENTVSTHRKNIIKKSKN